MTLPGDRTISTRHATDRIVVDTGDLAEVERVLVELEIAHEVPASDVIPAFRVARVHVPEVTDEEIDRLDTGGAAREAIEVHNAAAGLHVPITALDVLMRLISIRAGREILMGKDRDMDQLEALPHLGGGEGLPAPAPEAAFAWNGVPGLQPPGGRGIAVGVLDSGMSTNPELRGRFTTDDFVPVTPPQRAWTGHATFVVGRILLRAPGAKVVVKGVLGRNGTARAWDVATRMAEFLETDVKILNMSLGAYTRDNRPPFLLQRAAEEVTRKMVLVAAAGNHGAGPAATVEEAGDDVFRLRVLTSDRRAPTWPAALDGDRVIAVGAASVHPAEDGVTLGTTDFTPREVPWIDVWAPGVDTVSTFLGGAVEAISATIEPAATTISKVTLPAFAGFATWDGTSMAAADVTGEIARLAIEGGLDPDKAWTDIRSRPPIRTAHPTDVRPRGAGNSDWQESSAG